jgi:hypothetical protein
MILQGLPLPYPNKDIRARRYFTERLIRACAELPKMCEFFHIPFQSGDNDILRQMKCARPGARCRCPPVRQHAALVPPSGPRSRAVQAACLPSSHRRACA